MINRSFSKGFAFALAIALMLSLSRPSQAVIITTFLSTGFIQINSGPPPFVQNWQLESPPMNITEGMVMVSNASQIAGRDGADFTMSLFADGMDVRVVNDFQFEVELIGDPIENTDAYHVTIFSASTGISGDIITQSRNMSPIPVGDLESIEFDIPIALFLPDTAAVPEPASMAVWGLLSSVVGVGAIRKRRKRRSKLNAA